MCFLVNMRNKLMQCTCFQPTQLVIIQASIMSVFTYVLLYVGYSVVWCQQDNKTGIAESMFFIFSIQCLAGKTRKVLSILVYFSLFVLFLIAEISTMNIYCTVTPRIVIRDRNLMHNDSIFAHKLCQNLIFL